VNKHEIKEEKFRTSNELELIIQTLSDFVKFFKIHYIDLSKVENKEVLNLILLEYLAARNKSGSMNR
jgi:hypothetical protein